MWAEQSMGNYNAKVQETQVQAAELEARTQMMAHTEMALIARLQNTQAQENMLNQEIADLEKASPLTSLADQRMSFNAAKANLAANKLTRASGFRKI